MSTKLIANIQEQIQKVAIERSYDVAGWGISWREAGPYGRMFATLKPYAPPPPPGAQPPPLWGDPAHVGELFGEPAVLFKEKINFKMPGGAGFKAHQDQQAGRGCQQSGGDLPGVGAHRVPVLAHQEQAVLIVERDDDDPYPWQGCTRPLRLAYVTANGNALPCCIAPFTGVPYDDLILGNYLQDGGGQLLVGRRRDTAQVQLRAALVQVADDRWLARPVEGHADTRRVFRARQGGRGSHVAGRP